MNPEQMTLIEDEAPFKDPPAGPAPIVIDRSTLERYANCPHQGFLIDKGFVHNSSTPADIGNEAHGILSMALRYRVGALATPREMREYIEAEAMASRPDIQPEVIMTLRRAYPLAALICQHSNGEDRNADDLLRFDGGDGARSGQVAADLIPATESSGAIRLTCELDLLLATASAEELELIDWKSGWAHWTAGDVKASFQFQFYVWVIFVNYPTVSRVGVRIFMTRDGVSTSLVTFDRDRDFYQIHRRLITAVETYMKYRDPRRAEDVPAWANPEKCSICSAAPRCSLAHKPDADLAVDPEGYLRQYVALDAAASQMKAALSAKVRKDKGDLIFGDVAFGTERPKAARAATCDVYSPERTKASSGDRTPVSISRPEGLKDVPASSDKGLVTVDPDGHSPGVKAGGGTTDAIPGDAPRTKRPTQRGA